MCPPLKITENRDSANEIRDNVSQPASQSPCTLLLLFINYNVIYGIASKILSIISSTSVKCFTITLFSNCNINSFIILFSAIFLSIIFNFISFSVLNKGNSF
jgi:hypothetical protein